jgi:pyruvate formate lyase activating enzyme
VTIPTLNDNADSVLFLKELRKRYPVIDQIELLPFRKLCTVKYEKLGIPFRFADLPEPSADRMQELKTLL